MCLAEIEVWALWPCPALPSALNRAWFRPGGQKAWFSPLRVGVSPVFVVHPTPTSGRPLHSLDDARPVKEVTINPQTGAAAKHPCLTFCAGVDPALHVLSYLGGDGEQIETQPKSCQRQPWLCICTQSWRPERWQPMVCQAHPAEITEPRREQR